MNFDTIRPMFEGHMTQSQVDGVNTILAASHGLDPTWRSYMLGTAFHETAQKMQPITEYGSRRYFDKYEPDTPIGDRLGNIHPGDGYKFRGRGYVQLTGRYNYARAMHELSVNLIDNPDLALDPKVASEVMRRGMCEGWFTGKKLEDYLPGDYIRARRIINGMDKANKIAGYAETFEKALKGE